MTYLLSEKHLSCFLSAIISLVRLVFNFCSNWCVRISYKTKQKMKRTKWREKPVYIGWAKVYLVFQRSSTNVRSRECHAQITQETRYPWQSKEQKNREKCFAYENSRLRSRNDFLQLDRLKCENSSELCVGQTGKQTGRVSEKHTVLSNVKYCCMDSACICPILMLLRG